MAMSSVLSGVGEVNPRTLSLIVGFPKRRHGSSMGRRGRSLEEDLGMGSTIR